MIKSFAIVIMCLIGIVSQISFAETTRDASPKTLKEKAEAALLNGDTVEACAIFRELKVETDSIARINYHNEIKAKRATYEIDELYLENKLQKGVILKKISLSLLALVLLLVTVFFYLRKRNKELEQARLKSKQLQEEAESSLLKKSKLLYTISNDMKEPLTEMKEITTKLQTADTVSSLRISDKLSDICTSAENLQKIYHQIIS